MDIDGRADELSLKNAIGSEDLAPSTWVSAPAIVHDTGSPIVSGPHIAQLTPRELRALRRDMAPIDDLLPSDSSSTANSDYGSTHRGARWLRRLYLPAHHIGGDGGTPKHYHQTLDMQPSSHTPS